MKEAARPAAEQPSESKRARGKAVASAVAEPIELGILNNFIGFHLRQAQDAAYRAFVRRSGLADFKPGRFAVMMVLHYNPGITQTALGRIIARDKSTVTPLIQDLERHGFVTREHAAADRRRVVLALSPAGEAALEELLRHVHAHDKWLDEVVGEGKPELLRLLGKIARAAAEVA